MKTVTCLLLCALLSACNATMSNRIACTVAKDKLYAVSEYGPVGVSTVIDDADRKEVCK